MAVLYYRQDPNRDPQGFLDDVWYANADFSGSTSTPGAGDTLNIDDFAGEIVGSTVATVFNAVNISLQGSGKIGQDQPLVLNISTTGASQLKYTGTGGALCSISAGTADISIVDAKGPGLSLIAGDFVQIIGGASNGVVNIGTSAHVTGATRSIRTAGMVFNIAGHASNAIADIEIGGNARVYSKRKVNAGTIGAKASLELIGNQSGSDTELEVHGTLDVRTSNNIAKIVALPASNCKNLIRGQSPDVTASEVFVGANYFSADQTVTPTTVVGR